MRTSALLLAASVAACSGIRSDVEFDPAADFRRYHTYAWGPHEGASSPAIDRRIMTAIDTQLAQKGFLRVERNADLEVRFRATVDPVYEMVSWEHGHGDRWGSMPAQVDVREQEIGAVQVDLIEWVSRRRAWRGRGISTLSPDAGFAERAARIDEGAKRMFRSFPPRQR